jgi:hypothetical protein
MQIASLLFVLAFIGLFAGIILLMVSAGKKDRARKAEVARSLGFTPIEKPDQTLTGRIVELHRHSQNSSFSLHNVFVRNTPEGQMVLYDLDDTSGDESSVVARMAVALVTPGRELPRFVIFPRINKEGKLASIANRALEWIASRNMEKVVMDDRPDFAQRYMVTAEDAFRVKETLNASLINLLVNISETLMISAASDALSVSTAITTTPGPQLSAEVLRPRLDLTLAISRCLDGS